MDTLKRLCQLLPAETGEQLQRWQGELREVRLRADRPAQLIGGGREWLSRDAVSVEELRRILAALMDYSLYAREEELSRGCFTMADGCRVGVCGRMLRDGRRVTGLTSVGSLCVRMSREVRGCGEAALNVVRDRDGLHSTLIVSPPGLGKTTMLRDVARALSEAGHTVCIADERHELAGSVDGVPTLDVGTRTDVMDGGPVAEAIGFMLRSGAPEVIVADEIGGPGDAQALADAARCGVCAIASAHAADFAGLRRRRVLRELIDDGVFTRCISLGDSPGRVAEIWCFDAGEGWHEMGAGIDDGGGLRGLRTLSGKRRAAQGQEPRRADSGTEGASGAHDADA